MGQLARAPNGLRLLDIDDLRVGEPAWGTHGKHHYRKKGFSGLFFSS